ncbi:lipoprotein [Yeosuana aromativorans]|uniref:Lipoprotein n=1 Tax=Yeosuana aromativorans TaxID=288019 RepID=A0A8J3BLW3_9FLAO|nr:head GIN domain-containing protein [Yeosuana aromativorans]GGK20527.1 lipoprotein [Yeosuana aromativorans]
MTTLTKIIATTLLSFLLFSCNFDFNITGVQGNGNVQSENRTLNEPFNAIKASHGLDVYLTQGDEESIVIEADENLHQLIKTEVKDNTLHIYAEKNIGHASSKKIMVSFKDISAISSSSGSDVVSTNTISSDRLELNTSSGSDMILKVNTTELDCNSSSGSDLKLSGTTQKLIADASSGSDIKAGELKAESSQVKASSGADITVNTVKELTASASSGGDITYYGNPEVVNRNDSPSGSIRKQ